VKRHGDELKKYKLKKTKTSLYVWQKYVLQFSLLGLNEISCWYPF